MYKFNIYKLYTMKQTVLINLGLLIISLVVIGYVYMSVGNTNKEGFSFEASKVRQRKYLKDQDKYTDSRLFPQTIKNETEDTKFLKFNNTKTKLEDVSPSGSVGKRDISKKIEKCDIINRTGNCGEITSNGCGYCWLSDKIIAGDEDGPFTDVCDKKHWVKPGPRAAYMCQKKKEQELCKTMKDCGDATGEKSICGWCPLTGKGVPKKALPGGGWAPKYSDDKCNWRDKMSTKTKWLGWTPSKGGYPNRDPSVGGEPLTKGEGDCDRDSDCGPGLKCGHDGNLKGVVDSNGNKINPPAGYRDYCYDPNAKDFVGTLIEPKDCKRFSQMFPCVGPNMMTGPHSDECLQSQWEKSGCNGNLRERVQDRNDYNNWNSHAYSIAGDNMREAIFKTANYSNDYNKSNSAYRKCYGREVEPCLNRFRPRPVACAKKLYAETGCTTGGELNPEKQGTWPNAYVGQAWKNGQKGDWSNTTYQNNVISYRREAQRLNANPKSNFDRAIYTNLLCYGEKPDIPWDKPCWDDFKIIMSSIPGVNVLSSSSGNLSFRGANNSFKNLLTVGTRGWWKNEYTWTGNYELTKQTYEKAYFPFWNFKSTARNWWNNNWNLFKQKMLSVPGVTARWANLYFKLETPFSNLTSYSRSQTAAESQGIFLLIDRQKIITPRIFTHPNFPYWDFIRVANSN